MASSPEVKTASHLVITREVIDTLNTMNARAAGGFFDSVLLFGPRGQMGEALLINHAEVKMNLLSGRRTPDDVIDDLLGFATNYTAPEIQAQNPYVQLLGVATTEATKRQVNFFLAIGIPIYYACIFVDQKLGQNRFILSGPLGPTLVHPNKVAVVG